MTPQKIPIRLLRVRGNKSLQRFSSIEIGKIWDYSERLNSFQPRIFVIFYIAILPSYGGKEIVWLKAGAVAMWLLLFIVY